MNIVWFQRDLRLSDNPALSAAAKNDEILAVYIIDEAEEFAIGGASRWWLHASLAQLNNSLEGKLHFFKGSATTILPEMAKAVNATAVYWNNCYEPAFVKRSAEVAEALQKMNIKWQHFNGLNIWTPDELLKSDGTPYKIFAPYLKASLIVDPPAKPLIRPRQLKIGKRKLPGTKELDGLQLLPKIKWYSGMEAAWTPGEEGAGKLLKSFVKEKLAQYAEERNFPSHDILSRLSPHLHYGELSPAALWHGVHNSGGQTDNTRKFLSELTWRDFAYSLLYHFPSTATKTYNQRLSKLKWHYNKRLLKKWQQGQTGFPIVDAGMRQLWQTGYMHNRVRMITASFLSKNLLIDWRKGAEWFMDCLVDADLALNTMNWQWVAGTGLDAAPFFRVFNPVLQSKKYDGDGTYISTYVPELAGLPKRYLHEPWKASEKVLREAGIRLGKDYPEPCIDLTTSVKEALSAFQDTKR